MIERMVKMEKKKEKQPTMKDTEETQRFKRMVWYGMDSIRNRNDSLLKLLSSQNLAQHTTQSIITRFFIRFWTVWVVLLCCSAVHFPFMERRNVCSALALVVCIYKFRIILHFHLPFLLRTLGLAVGRWVWLSGGLLYFTFTQSVHSRSRVRAHVMSVGLILFISYRIALRGIAFEVEWVERTLTLLGYSSVLLLMFLLLLMPQIKHFIGFMSFLAGLVVRYLAL